MSESVDILQLDELPIYFGKDYVVNKYISIHQPTIGEIIDFGEERYFNVVNTLVAIPSDMKSILEEQGIDYNTLDDFTLFKMLTRQMPVEDSSIFFGDLDFTEFVEYDDTRNGEVVLYNERTHVVLDRLAYLKIAGYIRYVNNLKPKVEHASTETVRQILIALDKEKREKDKGKPFKSQLKPLISAMMRYPGFKYKKNELIDCGLYEFMDSVNGARIYVSSTALLQGSYSGMIDTSKIDNDQFNWLRDA